MNLRRHLEVGYVARAHGLHGELGVKTFDPTSQSLFEVERVLLRAKDGSITEMAIESVRPGAKDVLVTLSEIDGRAQAEARVGSSVLVFREDLPPLDEGEFFLGDLVGLAAVDEAGSPLGRVEEVMESGPVPNLVVRGEGGAEVLVPFVEPFVGAVELASGKVTIRPPQFEE